MWEGEPASRPVPRMDEPSPVWPEVTVFSVGVELSPAAFGTWSVEQLGCCLCLPGSGREEKQGCWPGAGEDWPSDTGTENLRLENRGARDASLSFAQRTRHPCLRGPVPLG